MDEFSRGENIYVAYCAIEGVMLARVPAEGFCGEAVKNAVTYEEMFDGCQSFSAKVFFFKRQQSG